MIERLRSRCGWRGLTGLALLLATSLLAACTVSLPGGLAGILVVLSLGGLLFGLGGASVSGCGGSTSACLSLTRDGVGPCLGAPQPDGGLDTRVGPCLGMAQPDGGLDVRVGPCLDPLPPDLGPDQRVGPCLSAPRPDLGRDARLGPCLSMLPPDASARLQPARPSPRAAERAELLARHAAALPEDVLARLRAGGRGVDDPEA